MVFTGEGFDEFFVGYFYFCDVLSFNYVYNEFCCIFGYLYNVNC